MIHTDTTPGSSREGHEGVVVTVGRALRQEVVRVELVGVGVHVGATVELVGGDDDCGARWYLLAV